MSEVFKKRKRSKSGNRSISSLANKVESLARRMPKVEVKQALVSLSSGYVTRAWQFALFNGLIPGTVDGTREGSRVSLKSLELNLHVENIQQQPTNSVTIRLVLFRMERVLGGAPTDAFVFGGSGLSIVDVIDHNMGIKVLRDVCFDLDASSGATGPYHNSHNVKMKVPLNFITLYNGGSAGTVADIEANALYLAYCGGPVDGSVSSRWPTIQGTGSLLYADA